MTYGNTVLYGIVGPTACGKTSVGVQVAKLVNAEILSADSVQVYRGMDIGSAKPTMVERQGVPHHMLDCFDIDSSGCSVSGYREAALACIPDIVSRTRIPLIVGGSGLYVNALTQALNFAVPSDPAVRKRCEDQYDASPEAAWQRLNLVDPLSAQRLHRNDKKRIVRALEVFDCAGKPLSEYGNGFAHAHLLPPPYPSRLFGLTLPRETLYQRIDERVDSMMSAGLEREAHAIWSHDYDRSLPAMQSIGYRQLFAYFDRECSLAEAVERIKLDTHHYAKRQYTWFKRDPDIRWLDVSDGAAGTAEWIAKSILEAEHENF